jgi:chromosomal replication initiator protein
VRGEVYLIIEEGQFSVALSRILNEPRNIAVYLLRQIRGDSLNNIGRLFNVKSYSTVSSILQRVSKLKKHDKKIKKQIEKIQDSINKGQRQT